MKVYLNMTRNFLKVFYGVKQNRLRVKDELINGIADNQHCIDYFDVHFRKMLNAIEVDEVNLMGYTTWRCIGIISESIRNE